MIGGYIWWVYVIGLCAQLFFSARILIQWIMTERAHKIVSPSIFWKLSIIGSWLLCIYGFLRDDFSIVLGQVLTYYIYIWNLNRKGEWKKVHIVVRSILILTPILAIISLFGQANEFIDRFFKNSDIPFWMVAYGSAGQIIFILRFVYQWDYSRRHGVSVLPIGFWVISLTGSIVIVSYALMRLDPVLILGQSFGFVSYIRNIIIGVRSKNKEQPLIGD